VSIGTGRFLFSVGGADFGTTDSLPRPLPRPLFFGSDFAFAFEGFFF
jgi:hypothetical protein